MKDNYTPEDLILYLYKETNNEQTLAIEQALQRDWTLMEKFKVLQASIKRLEELKEDIKQLEKYDKYAEKRLMIELKKGGIISSITMI